METAKQMMERRRYFHSTERSLWRREQTKRRRRLLRLLAIPAVVGVLVLAYYVTLSMPVEHWYIGLAGVALVVPYLTRRTI